MFMRWLLRRIIVCKCMRVDENSAEVIPMHELKQCAQSSNELYHSEYVLSIYLLYADITEYYSRVFDI